MHKTLHGFNEIRDSASIYSFVGKVILLTQGLSGEQQRSLEWWCSGHTIASGSQGAAIRPLINGCRESEISPASGQPVIRLNGVMGSIPGHTMRQRDATGERQRLPCQVVLR